MRPHAWLAIVAVLLAAAYQLGRLTAPPAPCWVANPATRWVQTDGDTAVMSWRLEAGNPTDQAVTLSVELTWLDPHGFALAQTVVEVDLAPGQTCRATGLHRLPSRLANQAAALKAAHSSTAHRHRAANAETTKEA